MKKIFQRIKKVIIAIGLAIISIPNKIQAAFIDLDIKPTSNSVAALYGIPRTKTSYIYSYMAPIALMIGLIVYCCKSKSNLKRKIIIAIISIAVAIGLYFLAEYRYNL